MSGHGYEPSAVSEEQHTAILHKVIIPKSFRGSVAQTQPVAVFVAGQTGCGKSTRALLVKAVLDRRGGAVLVSSDAYKQLHPYYLRLLAANDRSAGLRVRATVRRWQAQLEAHVRRGRFDVVVESSMADLVEFRRAVIAYRTAGYRVEVVVVATAEPWSQLGVLDRYSAEVETRGVGRYVHWDNHDECVDGMMATLVVVEADCLVDRITVVDRDGAALYGNVLVDGVWQTQPGAAAAVAAERERPWSAEETCRWQRAMSGIEQRLGTAGVSEEQRLAVGVGVQRAAALAEPVRRLAQVRLQQPGVDFHRLSAAHHQWFYNEVIAPAYLGQATSCRCPVVVFVMGQPGAGKTDAGDLVQPALGGRTAVRVSADDFKDSHPDYRELLQSRPRDAGEFVRADVKGWQRALEAELRARRMNAVIEIAPPNAGALLERAAAFHRSGYRVEVVVLAVRAADSRQGTARRFADMLQVGMAGRFTTAEGHDRCYRGVEQSIVAAEGHPTIAMVTVVRRDGQQLYRSERGADGQWGVQSGAAAALADERLRAYTPVEAWAFLHTHRFLLRALPQYRSELERIAAMARPMLPAWMRPRPLSIARGADLPMPAPKQCPLESGTA